MNIRGFKFVGDDKEGYDIYVISRGWFGRDKVMQLCVSNKQSYMDNEYRVELVPQPPSRWPLSCKVDKIESCHKIMMKYLTDKCPISIVAVCD